MKILMLGWEYPPKITGGLGVACQGLAEALGSAGHQVHFLLPKKSPKQVSSLVKLIGASRLKPDLDFWKKEKKHTEVLTEVSFGKILVPYLPPQTFERAKKIQKTITKLEPTEESDLLEKVKLTGDYNGQLSAELIKYAMLTVQTAHKVKPDVIHAHDWITFRAGRMAKKALGKPLFVHVHSTEYDRNGQYAQPFVLDEERAGFEAADRIFCVSEKLKLTIIEKYQVTADRITVVPNALTLKSNQNRTSRTPKNIAFIGRLTSQKSPGKLIDIARDMSSKGNDFQYMVIGDGYLMDELKGSLSGSPIANRFTFTGFLDRTELLKKMSQIDLLVMPSASEPFGLVALEAILKGIPVVAAKGSGISEFVPSMPEVELWDSYSYNNIVERLMTDAPYRETTVKKCQEEAGKLSWAKSVKIVEKAYSNH
ncbi:MAG: glycosyltransferase family 4 protein [Cyclobacteriaceae bacterium]